MALRRVRSVAFASLIASVVSQSTRPTGFLPPNAVGAGNLSANGFGSALSQSASAGVLVGAYLEPDARSAPAGAAYYFATGIGSGLPTLIPPPSGSSLNFGNDVGCSSDCSVAIIGAPGSGTQGGSAYIYTQSGGAFTLSATLRVTPAPASGDMFGATVAIDAAGKAALVCAPNTAVNSLAKAGRCWVFSGNNFGTVTPVSATTPLANANFGGNDGSAKIATQADGTMVVAIGAPGPFPAANTVSSTVGSVQISRVSKTGTVVSSSTISGSAGDQLGTMVVMSSDGMLVVAGASTAASGAGSVRIFTNMSTTWSDQTLSSPSAGAIGFGFGLALSADSLRLVVGAGYNTTTLPGQAFTFTASAPGGTYLLENSWTAPSPAGGDGFAYCVGIAGDSNSITATASASPSALVYLPSTLPAKPVGFIVPVGVSFGNASANGFGSAMSQSASAGVLVGAYLEPDNLTNPVGAAYYLGAAGLVVISPPLGSSLNFGNDVGCSSDCSVAIIGAPGSGTQGGSAYIYPQSGGAFTLSATLKVTPAPASGDMFGATVAIDAAGKAALVCAPNAAVGSVTGAGRCWVFSGYRFGTVTPITATTPLANANFGGNDGSAKIATQADGTMVVAIGAPGLPVTNSVPVVAGSVQVTRISSAGSVVSSFTRSGSAGDQLGTMIVMSSDGNLVFAGASTAASGIGTVTVLRSTSNVWNVPQTLNVSSAGAIGFGFGLALSADLSRLVVGAGYSKTLPGQAFTFSSTPSGAYVLENQWAAPSPAAGDAFAYCVGIAGDSSSITATGPSSTVLAYLQTPGVDLQLTISSIDPTACDTQQEVNDIVAALTAAVNGALVARSPHATAAVLRIVLSPSNAVLYANTALGGRRLAAAPGRALQVSTTSLVVFFTVAFSTSQADAGTLGSWLASPSAGKFSADVAASLASSPAAAFAGLTASQVGAPLVRAAPAAPPKYAPMAPIPISIAAGVLFGITGAFLVGTGVFFAAKAVVRLFAKPEVAPATTPEKAA